MHLVGVRIMDNGDNTEEQGSVFFHFDLSQNSCPLSFLIGI